VLFDGREDALLYWMSDLSRSEKEELLHIEAAELGAALSRASLGADSSASLSLEAKKLQELQENAELMTAARCIFVDAIYAEGKAKSLSEQQGTEMPPGEAASMDMVVHSVLGIIERHVMLSLERSSFYMRMFSVVLLWIWAWSTWTWWVRYPLMLALSAATVAAAAAGSKVASAATEEEREQLAPFWRRAGELFIRFKAFLIRPFDDPANPVLLRCRTDLFLSALIVLENGSWALPGRYSLLIFLALLLPAGCLWLDGGSGGWNKSASMAIGGGASQATDSTRGKRLLRHLSLGLSGLLAVYYAASSWTSAFLVAALFFPAATTVVLTSGALAITASFLVLNKLQARWFLGEAPSATRSIAVWVAWFALCYAQWSGYASSGGWMFWMAAWAATLLATPPTVSFVIQLAAGGSCSVLLSVGLATAANVLVKLAQLLLTREGAAATVALFKAVVASVGLLLRELLGTFRKGFQAGQHAKQTEEEPAAAGAAAAGGSEPSADDASQMN